MDSEDNGVDGLAVPRQTFFQYLTEKTVQLGIPLGYVKQVCSAYQDCTDQMHDVDTFLKDRKAFLWLNKLFAKFPFLKDHEKTNELVQSMVQKTDENLFETLWTNVSSAYPACLLLHTQCTDSYF